MDHTKRSFATNFPHNLRQNQILSGQFRSLCLGHIDLYGYHVLGGD